MHRYLFILALTALLLGACASSGNGSSGGGEANVNPDADGDTLEAQAYEATGDVRVYYYVKETLVPGATGDSVQQDEMRHVLINKSHSFYQGVPDHEMADEERFLFNADMYDLLKIFKELGLFNRGNAVNILGDDPIVRADSEPRTTRVIAVEIIKDGDVNTSYFARRMTEHEADPDRARLFNDCQAVLMQAIAGALPKGEAKYGEGDRDRFERD